MILLDDLASVRAASMSRHCTCEAGAAPGAAGATTLPPFTVLAAAKEASLTSAAAKTATPPATMDARNRTKAVRARMAIRMGNSICGSLSLFVDEAAGGTQQA